MTQESRAGQKYFLYAGWATVFWVCSLAVYYRMKPALFLRMFPDELAATLAGWFTPIAVVWAGTAVIYQRRELLNATERADDAATETFRKAAGIHLDRMVERLAMGAQRLARTCELCELHKRGESTILLGELLGRPRMFEELYRSKEFERLLLEGGDGLDRFVSKMEDDWVLDINDDALDDLATDIRTLHVTCVAIIDALESTDPGYDKPVSMLLPSGQSLTEFRQHTGRSLECVDAIWREYSSL